MNKRWQVLFSGALITQIQLSLQCQLVWYHRITLFVWCHSISLFDVPPYSSPVSLHNATTCQLLRQSKGVFWEWDSLRADGQRKTECVKGSVICSALSGCGSVKQHFPVQLFQAAHHQTLTHKYKTTLTRLRNTWEGHKMSKDEQIYSKMLHHVRKNIPKWDLCNISTVFPRQQWYQKEGRIRETWNSSPKFYHLTHRHVIPNSYAVIFFCRAQKETFWLIHTSTIHCAHGFHAQRRTKKDHKNTMKAFIFWSNILAL